jgi:lipoprotein NlpI
MKALHVIPLLLTLPVQAEKVGTHPPVTPEKAESLQAEFKANIDQYTELLKKYPDHIRLYSRRGDNHLFAGNFKESIADYEKMIQLDPSQDAPHWRLGIAYYYDNRFRKGMEQFAKYHAYDAVDRENGVWKFFCQANCDNITKAQKEMLPYTRFDRHPFPELYDLLEGKEGTNPESILQAAEDSKEDKITKDRRFFFAHFYIGMWYETQGIKDQAIQHLWKATYNPTVQATGTYMWQVARIHYDQLTKDKWRIPEEKWGK